MKKIYLGLSIVLLLCVIYLAMVNFNNYALINVLSGMDIHRDGLVANGQYLAKAVRISTYTVLILLSGIFVGAGTVYMFLSAQKEKVKAYQRELEKTSISGLDNASRVEVLEAKIKTLEKAFNTVIDERTKLEVQIKTLNAEIDNLNKG
ncbi:MAG: hypothetical protein DK841_08260 [Candidatus Melainabacteria bacterium]|nr:MAG: hypothetical protein DK841_08260 [Candidatus Melainabacteria bacterium]